MTAWTDNTAFRWYLASAGILVLKMLFSAVYTGRTRQRVRGYVNPEDGRVFGSGAPTQPVDPPEVAHALRIQRNDVENIPAYLIVAFAYVLAGASSFGAAAYFGTYTVARIAHTVAYTFQLQPMRAICWIVGSLCTAGICVQLLLVAAGWS